MSIDIFETFSHFPKKIRKNSKVDNDKFSVTGINKRHISGPEENSLTNAKKCIQKVKKKYDLEIFDFILLVTQTSPYSYPNLSSIIQGEFDFRDDVFALDINLGCSGFVFSLNISESLINSNGYRSGIIICTDTYTKFITKKNKSCYPIFSDCATVTIIKKNRYKKKLNYLFGSDGKGSKDLYLKKDEKEMYMNGANVVLFTLKKIPNLVNEYLKKNKLKIEDIDYFFFHQASKFVCDNLQNKLKIPKSKIYNNYDKYGNTVSSSIPLLIKDEIIGKDLKGKNLLLCGFGVGLSWGITNYKL